MPTCKNKNLNREKIYTKHGLKTEWVQKRGCKVILPTNNDSLTWKEIEKISIFKT